MLLLHATHAVETSNVVLLLSLAVLLLAQPAPHMHARVMPVAPETSVVYATVAPASVVYVAVARETSVVHAVHVDRPKSLVRKLLLETLIPCTNTTQ